MAEEHYKRLTRERAKGVVPFGIVAVTRSSLWLGSDHLLLAQRNGFTESYKRFYFRDIQVITLQATRARAIWNAIFATLACIVVVIALSTIERNDQTALIIWGCVLFVLCGVPMLFNTLYGQACTGYIRSAVQTERIPSLCRMRRSQKVLTKILPLIVAAQGQLSAEEVAARIRDAAGDESVAATAPTPPIIPPIVS